MLGEALKTSGSDESAGLLSVKFDSQTVGLFTLLAVSGAVAIIMISKQKLWRYLFESTQATYIRLSTAFSHVFSSDVTSSSIPTASSVDDGISTGMVAQDSWDCRANEVASGETSCRTFTDDVSGDNIAQTGISSITTANDPSSDKAASEAPAWEKEIAPVVAKQSCTPSPKELGIKVRHVLKKVQFAPDVVEPSGDGREYRGRLRTARNISYYMSRTGKQKGWESANELRDLPLSSIREAKAVIKGHGYQILTKPKLPANRMALYGGMLGYFSQMTLDW